MRIAGFMLRILIATAIACSSFVQPLTAEGQTTVEDGPIVYRKDSVAFSRQRYSSEIYPFLSEAGTPFQYSYQLMLDVSESEPRLTLSYSDGQGEGLMGMGWHLTLETGSLPADSIALDVLTPMLIPYEAGGAWYLLNGDQTVAVERIQEEGQTFYVAKTSPEGKAHRFLHLERGDGPLAIPFELSTESAGTIKLEYDLSGEKPLLRRISIKSRLLSFHYGSSSTLARRRRRDDQQERLVRITLTEARSSSPVWLAQWELAYETDVSLGLHFLAGIKLRTPYSIRRNLRFTYGATGRALRRSRPASAKASSGAQNSGMWKLVEGDPRWRLPPGLSIGTRPGLRFMDLNLDGFIDIVETQNRPLNSWLWNPKQGRWQEFGSVYKPYRASVSTGQPRPLGAHYIGLVKVFKKEKEKSNTYRFQSYAVSYYEPEADDSGLKYTSYVCFPRVHNSELKPDPKEGVWDCDYSPLLRLPVPLQYEGQEPWPQGQEGIKSVERPQNQGAQFVDFTRDGHLNLFYIGLRYRDAESGKVLLADSAIHRDTGNCREWYETTWENAGLKRRVKVDVCQAFWRAREKVWSEQYPEKFPGQSFWVRRDLGPGNRPTGQFILPWQADPHYYAHYEGFRNVTFARLDRGRNFPAFALVQSRQVTGEEPEENWPEARDIYVLKDGRWHWERLGPDSGYYPPAEFFERFKGIFADVDGDGLDDAILATGGKHKTWLNSGRNPRWKDAPEFYLPERCDLSSGNCRLVDLNNDTVQDLILGDGSTVYINQALKNSGVRPTYMTSFTDEKNRQRLVSDVQ